MQVILITIDALRADHLGCYGYKRATSGCIDRLAADGVLFENAVSGATFTHPSLMGLLTSRLVKYNIFKTRDSMLEIGNDPFLGIITLPEFLRAHGYRTGFFAPYVLSSVKCFERSFDDYCKCPPYLSKNFFRKVKVINPFLRRLWLALYRIVLSFFVKHSNENADVLTRRGIAWIKKNKKKPFFLWLHYFDVHAPYRPPKAFKSIFLNDGLYKTGQRLPIKSGERGGWGGIPDFGAEGNIEDVDYYVSQYDASIVFVDQQIGILMDALRKEGLEEDALVILTSDHGTCLGEGGVMSHAAAFPSESVVRVPLIIKQKRSFKSNRVFSQAQNTGLAPTILDMLHFDRPHTMQGESFLSLLKGENDSKDSFAFFGGSQASAIRGAGYKMVRIKKSNLEKMNKAGCDVFKDPFFDSSGDAYFLYRLKEDPYELVNRMSIDREKGMELSKKLEEWLKSEGREFGNAGCIADVNVIERLKSLGYI